jgi:hypothetical protein
MIVQPQECNLPVVVMMPLTLAAQLSCAISTVNMTAPITISTKEGQHIVITFLWAESVRIVEILHRLSPQYGNSALLQLSVCK